METLREKFRNKDIILASASPRRQEMLSSLGLKFRIQLPCEYDESYPSNLQGADIALYLAKKKANSFGIIKPEQIIITSDTIVLVDEKVLEKPVNYSEAYQMLKLLSNRYHYVISGVCIKSSDKTTSFDASTKVKFSNLSDEDIRYYIENYKPYDKAGAYGIQEWIGLVGIESIEGSFYNVVGLPVQKLHKELLKF
jgi:septum formation protein